MSVRLLLFAVKFVLLMSFVQNKLVLKQVVIINRHSLRAPLSNNLNDVSPKAWPNWHIKPGSLTAKGAKLAGYMGHHITTWLRNEGVLPASCPSENDFQIFSNTMERTLATAQSIVENSFPYCKINIRHPGADTFNPLFSAIIHNTSTAFTEQALKEIHTVLDTLRLNKAYDLLNDILDYKQSRSCIIDNKCDLHKDKNYISIIPGFKLSLTGPLKIGQEVTDAFLMQKYEGFANEDVAWGLLTDANSWQTIFELNRGYYNATYRSSLVAKDISRPLIKLMSEIFLEEKKPKVTLLIAHDVNIYTVFKTLLVRPYILKKQIEVIPIGSAAVFQKWTDDECGKDYFKLSFMYQSTEQIRYCNNLDLNSPPQNETLELEICPVDINGLCPWKKFETLLDSL